MALFPAARRCLPIAFAVSAVALWAGPALAQAPQDQDQDTGRVALVIGNAAYPARPLPTAVNDAGLVAEMVRNAGYDLVEARDVDETLLRQTVRGFLDKVAAAGPDAVAFVYLSGYGLQFEGENYFVPVSARLARVTDIPTEAFRIGDLVRALAGMNVAARIVVLDMGREHPFLGGARTVPPGLAIFEPGEGALVAFSTGPGEVMGESGRPYGVYATALVEMATKPGMPLDQLFKQVRLRVHEASRGAVTPWHVSRITGPVLFFEGESAPDDSAAPPQLVEVDPQAQQMLGRPLATLSPDQAYAVVLERDTIAAYQEFLVAFPNHPLARRVRLLLAEQREALIWRRTVSTGTPEAYWSYLRRYPRGPHAAEASRRLAALTAPPEPPPGFVMMDYGFPPPPPDEVEFFEDYYATYYAGMPPDYAPPPPFPVFFLPVLDPAFVDLSPPKYYEGVAYLPVPGAIMLRRAIRPARPLFVFRRDASGPPRTWHRPLSINRFGGQAPTRFRTLPGGTGPANVQPRVTPLVQPGMGSPKTGQEFKQPPKTGQEFKQLPKSGSRTPGPTDQRLLERQQRERVLEKEKSQQHQQQQQRVLEQQQKSRVIDQQPRDRTFQHQKSQQQQQQQQQQGPRVIQQQQQQQRVIQQQHPQQRVIQQQQQQQPRVIQQQQPARPQPQPQKPSCPHGTNPNGSCK